MKKRGLFGNSRAQVWVETVVYTLIGLTIIGIVIGIATPRIQEITDEAIIEQTITVLTSLNGEIKGILSAAGNSRTPELKIKKGRLLIDAENDKLIYTMEETGKLYSQPGDLIKQGDLFILTEDLGDKKYSVSLILDYSPTSIRPLDITYNEQDINKELTSAPTSYELLISNKGGGNIDILLV